MLGLQVVGQYAWLQLPVSFKKVEGQAGQMAQWLRPLHAFPEDLNSVPRIHVGYLTIVFNSGSTEM